MNAPAPGHNQPAAIKATYVNWKTVTTRDVLQLIFEVPLAAQAETLSILGAPLSSESKWCAIALLREPGEATGAEAPAKERQNWDELSPTQQAGILCGDGQFIEFIEEQYAAGDYHNAADFVRVHCDVVSRKQLSTDELPREKWRALDQEYRQWAGLEAQQRG